MVCGLCACVGVEQYVFKGVCVHFCVCSILCGGVQGYGTPPLLACFTTERGWGILCMFVHMSVCFMLLPSSIQVLKDQGCPGGGGSRTHRRIPKERLSHFHPTRDHVICLLPPTVGSLGSMMPSLCLPPTTE